MKDCILISSDRLNSISNEAQSSPRKRKNFNYHELFSDPMNRMLNAFEPGTYCQPHKHENPDKREVFIVLKGTLGIVIFDDEGQILSAFKLSPYPGNPGIEIPEKVWHMALALEPGTVAYELKDGPYNPDDDKNFAPWSPAESDPEGTKFLKEVIKKAGFET